MPRFQFALKSTHEVREAGVVQSESFSDALTLVSKHITVRDGDTLEIGVAGFPPARYEFVPTENVDAVNWRPLGLLAA